MVRVPATGDLSFDRTCAPNTACVVFGSCPVGTTVISGGYQVLNDDALYDGATHLNVSYATNARQWKLGVENSDDQITLLYRIHLVCLEV